MARTNLRRQLQEAALRLFFERGYDQTTATEIAAEVGVTERTFFRHFPSKRDILFDEDALNERLELAIREAPTGLGSMDVLHHVLSFLIPLLEHNRPLIEPARQLIARTPALLERQLAKTTAMSSTLAAGLRRRGMEPQMANLAAAMGIAVMSQAINTWLEDASLGLEDCLGQAFDIWRRISSQ